MRTTQVLQMICKKPHGRCEPTVGFLLKSGGGKNIETSIDARQKLLSNQVNSRIKVVDPAEEIHPLLVRIQQEDASAWEIFVEIERKALWKYLPYRFDNLLNDDIEDIIQEVFLKVLFNNKFYRGGTEGEAKNWLHQIARNEAINHIRSMKKSVVLEVLLDEDFYEDENCEEISIEERSLEEISIIEIRRLVPELTTREAQVLLYIINGFKEWEIAEKLSLARPRISQLMKSIRAKVRDLRNGE